MTADWKGSGGMQLLEAQHLFVSQEVWNAAIVIILNVLILKWESFIKSVLEREASKKLHLENLCENCVGKVKPFLLKYQEEKKIYQVGYFLPWKMKVSVLLYGGYILYCHTSLSESVVQMLPELQQAQCCDHCSRPLMSLIAHHNLV